jgi:hypothetical protein
VHTADRGKYNSQRGISLLLFFARLLRKTATNEGFLSFDRTSAETPNMRSDERSVSELKRDAENRRADLTITVDGLRTKVSDTVDGIRCSL